MCISPGPLDKSVAKHDKSTQAHFRFRKNSVLSNAHFSPTGITSHIDIGLLINHFLTNFIAFNTILGFWQDLCFLNYLYMQIHFSFVFISFFTWRKFTWVFKSGIFWISFPRFMLLLLLNLVVIFVKTSYLNHKTSNSQS